VTCDDALVALVLSEGRDAAATAHVERCPECRADAGTAARLARALAGYTVAPPPAGRAERTLSVATPLLARRATRARVPWGTIWRALAVGLLPLPLLIALDTALGRAAHGFLRTVLPDAVSTYLVLSWAALLALLFALAYGAVPLLAHGGVDDPLKDAHA
jgi:hypothetical protein